VVESIWSAAVTTFETLASGPAITGNPGTDGFGNLQQSYLEEANVNARRGLARDLRLHDARGADGDRGGVVRHRDVRVHHNLFVETLASGPAITGNPGTDGFGNLQQSYLEEASAARSGPGSAPARCPRR
jgi:hypothetical protein